MRIVTITMGMLLIASTVAHAGKPSQAQAKKVATAWLAALAPGGDQSKLSALKALTAVPFASAVYDDDAARCPPTTTMTADRLGDAFACLGQNVDEEVARFDVKKYRKGDLGKTYLDQMKDVFRTKNALLVEVSTDCAGTSSIAVFAVVMDDKAAKVAGMVVVASTCGG